MKTRSCLQTIYIWRIAVLTTAASLYGNASSSALGAGTADVNSMGNTNVTGNGTANGADRAFIRQAAIGNIQEIVLGELAQTNSQDTNVQDFGVVLEMDHSEALAEVNTLAANHGVTLPSSNAQTKAIVRKFSRLQGAAFDQPFIQLMIKDHLQDIQRYGTAAQKGKSLDIRDYARAQLPVLTDHLDMALSIQEMLQGFTPGSSGITNSVSGTNGTAASTSGTTVTTTGTGTTGVGSGGGTAVTGTTGAGVGTFTNGTFSSGGTFLQGTGIGTNGTISSGGTFLQNGVNATGSGTTGTTSP